ncbi:hypothetical protein [Pelolinea submarina]|uniref:Broad-specificity ulvan lyase N-terminal domain-containing protein n=1 Tax=Pelolinea submarina TaxID=913107 RepID=A0A347ZVZ4_9CHLR|nr:hypothetical protein [Pelolinea submarina]REG07171.1 hypothetical protein DFR64_2375 [Pelolinea submarina]BBB49475.1 hypothetical protein Pelsub_P2706 [Pelolinea submarina]
MTNPDMNISFDLRTQVLTACRHLLSEINRDPATPTYGCFDRRYWGWKLVDFPEATFQRNLSALAWLLQQPEAQEMQAMLTSTLQAGLLYAARIQHHSGSFDQAYPYEESYGAAAFLVPDLLDAYLAVKADCDYDAQLTIEAMLAKAAAFLYHHAELHGTISNHLAGAALALLKAGNFLKQPDYNAKSREILDFILSKQSKEGWYVEYGGADPGYQTLCMYYLAQIYAIAPYDELQKSLSASLDFLQYFAQPDGSFGGEYGSRRTEIYYPGGIALLSGEFPLAAALTAHMLDGIEQGRTTRLADMDMGNTAPLLNNTIKALPYRDIRAKVGLPFKAETLAQDFPEAGIFIRATEKYYCVVGASTGGVTKVYDKKKSQLVWDDCGLLGQTGRDAIISTQAAAPDQGWKTDTDKLELWGNFQPIKSTLPGPGNFLVLRLMNLTVMRVGFLNELVKKMMVRMLISGGSSLPLKRTRRLVFTKDKISIHDRVEKTGSMQVKALRYGGKFSAIHMASSRYFAPNQANTQELPALDVQALNRDGVCEYQIEIKIGS